MSSQIEYAATVEPIQIADRLVGPGQPIWIIAEIGINHGGDEALCAEMIDAAAAGGADAVKLQTVTPEASYHPATESYRLFRDSLLSPDVLARLQARAETAGIILFSTPGDRDALALLGTLTMPAVKISSGLLTNLPLIADAARLGVPLVMSTGMAYEAEVAAAVETAQKGGARSIALMQCTSLYPAPTESLNLCVMDSLAHRFNLPVGYSDHHEGELACVAAAAMGACLIEKHFTLDCTAAGPDHAISLEPDQFGAMVQAIRAVERMRGNSDKAPDPAEMPLREGRHRRLVAARNLPAGEVLQSEDLYLMRLPADQAALPAARLDEVIGRRTVRAVGKLTGLTADIIEGMA